MKKKLSALCKTLSLLFVCMLFALPVFAAENQLSSRDIIITIDGEYLSDGDAIEVLTNDLNTTSRLNAYVFGIPTQTTAELRLYHGAYSSTSDYSETSPVISYPLSTQPISGYLLASDTTFTHGDYTLAVFSDSTSDTAVFAINISVSRKIISERITRNATCTTPGSKLLTFEDDGDPSTPETQTVSISELGHIWGAWEHIPENHKHTRICSRENCNARETNNCVYENGICTVCHGAEGHRHVLTHVAAIPPTCTDTGIDEHYSCDCGKKFRDAEGTIEINNQNSLVSNSLGHSYGGWSYNAATKTHTRICLRDLSHRETDNCTFDNGVTSDYSVLYSCTVCRGTYTKIIYEGHALRIYGSDRYETAFLTADALKKSLNVDKFENIVVASGLNFADALSGSYLANRKNAPILLVCPSKMDKVTDYINKNLAAGGTVYLLGGPNAIPEQMEDKLYNVRVERLQGANRYVTNIEILNETGTNDNEILICSGLGFADGLSVSAVDHPILLVNKSLTAEQKEYLAKINNAKFYIIGGEAAVCAGLENELKTYGSVERIYGANRYETSVNVAKKFFPDSKYAVLAYGENFPDGLSGGPLAHSVNAPLILTSNNRSSYAKDFADLSNIRSGIVLGGSGLISDASISTILALRNQEIYVLTR